MCLVQYMKDLILTKNRKRYNSPKMRLRRAKPWILNQRQGFFANAWQSISVIYEDYARKSGISYNSLYILNAILYTENCTQKQICEKTLLPKQTVNKVITGFFKSGYIELRKISSISGKMEASIGVQEN